MKRIGLIITILALAGCAQEEIAGNKNKMNIPTEVGNGAQPIAQRPEQTALTYHNPQYGFKINYEKDWKVLTNEGHSSVSFLRADSKDRVDLKFQTNPTSSAKKILKAYRTDLGDGVKNVSALSGFEAISSGERIIMANSDVVVDLTATSAELAAKFITAIKYLEPTCSHFVVGQWVQYRREVPGKEQASQVVYIVKEVQVENNKVIVERRPSISGPIEVDCNRVGQQLFSSESFKALEPLSIELGIETEVEAGSFTTTRIEETLHPLTRTVGGGKMQFKLVSEYSDEVPLSSVVLQSIIQNDEILERWSLVQFGNTGTFAVDHFDLALVSISQADFVLLKNMKRLPVAHQLVQARLFLGKSRARLAFLAYDQLLRDKEKLDEMTLSQKSEAHFGRAFTQIFLFSERAEYQEHLQRMGFDPYLMSVKLLGPRGFLAQNSTLAKGEKKETKRASNAPFNGRKEGEGVFNRSPLTFADHQKLIAYLVEDFQMIIKDLQLASEDENLVFEVPGGFHYGRRSYIFYKTEAKIIEAALHAVAYAGHLSLAYQSVDWPMRDFRLGKYDNISAKERRELELFVEEFNRSFMHLKDRERIEFAKKELSEALATWAEVIELALDGSVISNYVPGPGTSKVLKISKSHIEDAVQSLENGATVLKKHKNKPTFDLKKMFDEPFDASKSGVPLPLVIVEDEYSAPLEVDERGRIVETLDGVETYAKINHKFFEAWLNSMTKNWKDFGEKKKTKEAKGVRRSPYENPFFPGVFGEDFRRERRHEINNYLPLEIAGNILVPIWKPKKDEEAFEKEFGVEPIPADDPHDEEYWQEK